MDLGYDDVYLGYWIIKLGFKVYSLNLKFNYMHHFDEGGTNRLYTYIIHYAGQGFTGNRMGDLKRDYGFFYGNPPYPEIKNQAIIDEIPEDVKGIADVGCGEGFLTRYLQTKYKNVVGIDIENKNRVNLKYVMIWDIQDEPRGITPRDVVIASEVLEHVRWWKDALQNLLAITEHKLIITIPYGESFWSPEHINFWDDESVKEFITLCDGWDVKITKIITKPEDVKNNQLLFLIVCQK
jgi:SAM-dependent methyltransferase